MLDLPIFTKKGLYSGDMEEASAAAAAAAAQGGDLEAGNGGISGDVSVDASSTIKCFTIREWLLSLVPDIDAAGLNVIGKGLKKEGIETVGDLQEVINEDLFSLTDMTDLIKAAGVQKKKAISVLRAVKDMISQKGQGQSEQEK